MEFLGGPNSQLTKRNSSRVPAKSWIARPSNNSRRPCSRNRRKESNWIWIRLGRSSTGDEPANDLLAVSLESDSDALGINSYTLLCWARCAKSEKEGDHFANDGNTQ